MSRGVQKTIQSKAVTRNIRRAWEAFLSGERLPQNSVRNIILDSWRRSKRWGIDPEQLRAPLHEDRMRRIRQTHRELIDAARPVLQDMDQLFGGMNAISLLCSPAGVILHSQGARRAIDAAREVNILPGGVWQEDCSGTNAVGTALAINGPVQIYGSEHFCQGVKPWTCAASLVRDAIDGQVLGVVDISYVDDDLDCKALPLTMFVSRRVEMILHNRELLRRHLLLERSLEYSANSRHEGMLLLDRKGRLVRANDHAARALSSQDMDADLTCGEVLEYAGADGSRHPAVEKWTEQDWVHPVSHDRERIGSIVIVPFRSGRAVGGIPAGMLFSKGKGAEANSFLDGHRSPAMRQAASQARRVACVDIPIMLQGETGTGKEVMARAIHALSPRKHGPFVAVNCGAIPRDLLASELFGHAEGAFTGARRGGYAGKFEQANGGTILLDELGELPVDLQPYLLRVLENCELVPLGASSGRLVDVRIIAATNRNLEEALDAGEFRQDLYYRFSVNIYLPPLRERLGDFDRYLDLCLRNVTEEQGLKRSVSDELRAALGRYDFPGNLRELKNVVQHMVVISNQEVLTLADLPDYVQRRLAESKTDGSSIAHEAHSLKVTEAKTIAAALHKEQGNRSRAAKRLGISRTTLYRRLRETGRT